MSTLLIVGIIGMVINSLCAVPITLEALGQGTCPKWVLVVAVLTGWTSFIAIIVAAGFWTAVLYSLICFLFTMLVVGGIYLMKKALERTLTIKVVEENAPAPAILH